MTTATKRNRKPKAQPVQPVPVCNVCFKRLGWHDSLYCGGTDATMCKVCHQKSERKRLHGVYIPRDKMPHAPMVYGTERTAKLTARPAVRVAQKTAARANATPKSGAKAPKWERAQRRAEKNIRRNANKQARKGQAA